MNVYVKVLGRHLARMGHTVEMFTRATSDHPPGVTLVEDNVHVHHIEAGPLDGVHKEDLPALTDVFARNLLAEHPAPYDVVHGHYWLSGMAGLTVARAWGAPYVQTFHTSALVKNLMLSPGDSPEPAVRVDGERHIVREADLLIANTHDERADLLALYDADPARIDVITPGVDLDVFTPRDSRAARAELGLALDADVVMFAGRIQRLKGPHILLQAIAELLRRHPERRARLVVPLIGGPSGSGFDQPRWLIDLADELGISDVTRFIPPQPQTVLAQWYAAADVVAMPSANESFGLVAAEAQACATPVVATNVGGLRVVVDPDVSGLLIDGHDPVDWAEAIETILNREAYFDAGAAAHASQFSWAASAEAMHQAYARLTHPATTGGPA